MREIKFRVWDKNMKKWWCEDSIYLQMDGKKIHPSPWATLSVDLPSDNVVIQQYTGKNDINGKEIYEGDIVVWPEIVKDENIPNPYRNEDAGQFIYTTRKTAKQVIWSHYMRFALEDIPADGSMTYSFNQYCEVIGNICENPELLSK